MSYSIINIPVTDLAYGPQLDRFLDISYGSKSRSYYDYLFVDKIDWLHPSIVVWQ